jgi:cytosine/uracil/thiamine/allantoin permease
MAKSIIVPIAWIAILIWAFVSTDGGGDMWNQKATLTGSAYSWGFLSSLTSVIGNYATLSVNQVGLIHAPRNFCASRTFWKVELFDILTHG